MLRERLVQLAFVAAALTALLGAALLQRPIESLRDELELVTVTADENITKDPKTALLQVAPGGLRAPFLNYLWIRSQELKENGKFFDAMQLRELICNLMPHYPAVWAFLSWDMSYNISVQTYTPQERWMWVHNGIVLLRDKGLFYNPNDIILYRQLAWTYFHKMGEYTDEMHRVYKRRWAAKMQRVLGAPPISERTEEAVEAFRPIAEAPDDLETLRADKSAADFVDRLARTGVKPDQAFLTNYNRFSLDPRVAQFAWLREAPADENERRTAELMSSDAYAPGREKVLAFVRRKVLKETYRLDPGWMLQLMEKYGPLDWRSVFPHALYWATMGIHRVKGLDLKDINALNTERISLNSLKALTRTGRLYYTPNPKDPDDPHIDWQPDWRFIEPTHQAYITAGEILMGDRSKLPDQENLLRDGHLTYLSNSIMQLYVGGRQEEAEHYLREINEVLKPKGEVYQLPLEEFVKAKFWAMGTPPKDMAHAFWNGALRSAYRALAGGNHDDYMRYHAFAFRAYKVFMEDTGRAPRLAVEEFSREETRFLATMLLQPRAVGLYVPLLSKARLYNAISLQKQRELYPYVADPLRRECEQEGLDFETAFPAPPGAGAAQS